MDIVGENQGPTSEAENDSPKYVLQGPTGQGTIGDNLLNLSEADAQTRLQALLAKWMRMENLVVLLGAGCSCDDKLGGKTLWDLENAVLNVLEELYRQTENATLGGVIAQRKTTRDDLGFEAWLSCLSNALHLLSDDNSPIAGLTWTVGYQITKSNLADLLRDIEQATYAFCSLRLTDPAEEVLGHHAFLAKIMARDPSLGRAHVFTTNYDTLVEQALDHLGAQYADGFVGRVEPRFDPACYGLDVYYPGEVSEGRVRRYDKFVHLYKLHGSIHWQMPMHSGTVFAKHPSLEPFVAWRMAEGGPQQQAANLPALFSRDDRVVGILPTARKYTQTIDLPFAYLFRAFHQRLQQPQTFLIVIGYGFGDEHINSILDDAMLNPSLVLLVVDPKPSDLVRASIEKYQKLGERAFLLTARDQTNPPRIATFEDFATSVMPHVQWLNEFVDLRKLEKAIEQQGQSTVPEERQ
jgi:hypothetical protein